MKLQFYPLLKHKIYGIIEFTKSTYSVKKYTKTQYIVFNNIAICVNIK